MTTEDGCSRFAPSRVEGLPDVTEVTIHPDRLEFVSAGRLISYRVADIARWPRPAFLRRRLARLGWRPRWLPVGEHDGCHAPSERFIHFYTQPRIVIYMPAEPVETANDRALLSCIQEVLRQNGFSTWDLG
jgi:hypothetical protein